MSCPGTCPLQLSLVTLVGIKIGEHPCEEPVAFDEPTRGGRTTVSAVVVSRNDAFAPRMLNTRGSRLLMIFKNTNNTRILVRKTCILLYFIHEPPVFSIIGRRAAAGREPCCCRPRCRAPHAPARPPLFLSASPEFAGYSAATLTTLILRP